MKIWVLMFDSAFVTVTAVDQDLDWCSRENKRIWGILVNDYM